LILTNRRVLFVPRWFGESFVGRHWATDLSKIESVDVAEVDRRKVFAGGWVPRLALSLDNGTQERFVVDDVPRVASQIESARSG
jgi:hypothetical protein